jgi:hypothetical protein
MATPSLFCVAARRVKPGRPIGLRAAIRYAPVVADRLTAVFGLQVDLRQCSNGLVAL